MADTIREFLVGLGFKIDATSERKFVEGVQKATEQALALGGAMQAVAATITAAVVKIARDMDQMAYASERLGSSVKDIKAVSHAIGQMGGSPLVYNGEVITQRDQMISLTDMWKAQGADPARQAANWLASTDAKNFIEVLSPGNSGVMAKRGRLRQTHHDPMGMHLYRQAHLAGECGSDAAGCYRPITGEAPHGASFTGRPI